MMTALLLKDYYTLAKQAKIFLLIIIVFSFIPDSIFSMLAVLYATMLPMTSLAYDERSKWDNLAAMMPYSTISIVLGKYLLGYIAIVGACILSVIAQLIYGLVRNTGFDMKMLALLLVSACASVILLAINLPIMLRFGVEKGRIVFLVVFGFIGALTGGFNDKIRSVLTSTALNLPVMVLAALLIAIIISFISVFLSTKLYKRKAL